MFMENKRYLKKQANLYDTAAYLHFCGVFPLGLTLTNKINKVD